MSVTFCPDQNLRSNPTGDIAWSGSWHETPGARKILSPAERAALENFEDIDYDIYKFGHQPLDFWMDLARRLNLSPIEDYPWSKLFGRMSGGQSLMGIRIYGQRAEDIGMEMTLAYMNAEAFCQYLGIPESGHMNPIAMLKTIEAAKSRDMAEFTRPATDSHDGLTGSLFGAGPRVIDSGLSSEKFSGYIMRLEEICDHCIRYERDIMWG